LKFKGTRYHGVDAAQHVAVQTAMGIVDLLLGGTPSYIATNNNISQGKLLVCGPKHKP
jgi:hypothetical protein